MSNNGQHQELVRRLERIQGRLRSGQKPQQERAERELDKLIRDKQRESSKTE
jgi:hypothetical protein